MKPNNNFGALLTYGVPTAAALLGLLWLLQRRRGQNGDDDDDDTVFPADRTSLAGNVTELVTELPTPVRQDQTGDQNLESRNAADIGGSIRSRDSKAKVESGSGDGIKREAAFPQLPKGNAGDGNLKSSDEKLSSVDNKLTDLGEASSDVHVKPSSAVPGKKDQSVAAVLSSSDAPLLSSTVSNLSPKPVNAQSISREDPVQLLVRHNEEKLKYDDAAIVQAKLSPSTLQSNFSASPIPGFSLDALRSSTQKEPPLASSDSKSATSEKIVAHVQSLLTSASSISTSKPALPASAVSGSGTPPVKSEKPSASGESTGNVLLQEADVQSPLTSSVSSLSAPNPEKNQSVLAAAETESSKPQAAAEKTSASKEIVKEVFYQESHAQVQESKSKICQNTPPKQAENVLSDPDSSANKDVFISAKSSSSNSKSNTLALENTVESNSTSVLKETEECEKKSVQEDEHKPKSVQSLAKKQENESRVKSTIRNDTDDKTDTGATQNSQSSKETAATKDNTPSTKTVVTKDIKLKDSVAAKGASQKLDKTNSSSVIPSPPSAGAKASPPRQTQNSKTTSVTNKAEQSADVQTKVSNQQKSKSSPVSANSYSSKRRLKSGSSDRTSESTSCEPNSASQTSSEVSENGRVPDSGSPICDTNSEASNDSGRGGSVGETLLHLPGGEVVRYDFNFPSELCGRLIGRGGKNIHHLKEQSGASVALSSNPFTPEFQICRVQGTQTEVDRALMLIRKKFPINQFPLLDMACLAPPPTPAPVVLPEIMQLNLPEGVSIDIVVSAVVNAGHIFIQQPTHPTFPSLEKLNHFMNVCYGEENVPMLPRPAEGGIICAAESDGQWFRAQLMQVYPDEDECDIKYVDYGGYARVPINTLKQIRSDFMTLPFQALECYLANITPLQEEEYFSDKASEVLMELTSGKMLQGQVICRGDDSVCYVHLYQVSGHSVLLINREMVNREVVRWIEVL